MSDGRTHDFLGLPIFKRLYGFGDSLSLRVRMTTAMFARFDRRAVAGALPEHPKVKLHPAAPLVVLFADYLHCADNGDPDANDYRYQEAMIACVLEGRGSFVGPMFPLVLFLNDPVPMAAGREFHGFAKVPATVSIEDGAASVGFVSHPRGVPTARTVLSAKWKREPGLVDRALELAGGAIERVARAAGIDDDAVHFFSELAFAGAGETWNFRQVPQLENPRKAAYSSLTSFKPQITDPGGFHLVSDFDVTWPAAASEPVWQIGRRFFETDGADVTKRATIAFRWEATMTVAGGETIDAWLG